MIPARSGTYKMTIERQGCGDQDLAIVVSYKVSAYYPAVHYLPNGDPGYPAEGGDLESVDIKDSAGRDVYNQLTPEEIGLVEDRCYKEADELWTSQLP